MPELVPVITAIFMVLRFRLRRPSVLPVGGLLVGPADAEGHRLVARVADDLERGRQAARGEAVGHGEGAEAEIVHGPCEVSRGAALVHLVDRNRRGLSGRGEQRVHIRERVRDGLAVDVALRERQEVVAGRDAAPDLDARAYVRVYGQGLIVDEVTDEAVAFGPDDAAGGRRIVPEPVR